MKPKQLPILVVFATLILLSQAVSAHAVVVATSLNQPLAAATAGAVSLTFNSGIEVSLSRVSLIRKGDVHEPVHIRAGQQLGQLIIELPPLPSGEYAIKYKVFAADGHLTEDVVRFTVR